MRRLFSGSCYLLKLLDILFDLLNNKDTTCTPAELMYIKMGFVGLSYCRYMSSASSSSVTAGTNDIPCIRVSRQHCLHMNSNREAGMHFDISVAVSGGRSHQIHNSFFEKK